MNTASASKKISTGKVVWEGLKKPLICASLMFVASFALIQLQAEKAAFDKKQNAAFLLVNIRNFDPTGKDVRPVSVEKLGTFVSFEFPTLTPLEESVGFDPNKIIRKAADNVSFQTFKSQEELITRLNDDILRQKADETKARQNSMEKARLAENELDDQSIAAVNELETTVKTTIGGQIDLYDLLRTTAKTSPLRTAVQAKYSGPAALRRQVSSEVTTAVVSYYDDIKAKKQQTRNDIAKRIEKTENLYQLLTRSVYNQLTAPRTFNIISPPLSNNPSLALILDDKSGLGILQKAIVITLTGIILFAFLYLILIPLKHLFLWTTSGDVLTEQLKKLLEKKDSVITPTITRVVIAGIAAIGVGGAAIGVRALTSVDGSNPPPKQELEQPINRPGGSAPHSPRGPGPEGKTSDQLKIDILESRIIRLTSEVIKLQEVVRNIGPTTEPPNLDTRLFTTAVDELNNRLDKTFGTPGPNRRSTFFGNLDDIAANQANIGQQYADLSTKVNNNLVSFNEKIGNKNDPRTNQSVFGRLSDVSNTLGPRLADDPPVVESLRDLTATLGKSANPTNNNSLFGRAQLIQQSVNVLSDVAGSIRHDQLGTSGRNFITQTKTLFSSERYRVSLAAVAAIEQALAGENPRLLAALRGMIGEKEYSESQLFQQLKETVFDREPFDARKTMILRYTRVARW